MSDFAKDRVFGLAWEIQAVLQAASAGDYSKRCPVTITESFAENPLTAITPAINLLLDDLRAKQRAQAKAEARLVETVGELKDKVRTIEEQAEHIRRLSTPVIEIWNDVLVMPLIGIIDGQRGEALMEAMLGSVAGRRARHVILDLTGVESIDTAAADQLLRVVRAGELVGAHCVLTGLHPTTAMTLTDLGVELGEIRTLRTVKEGLRYCLGELES